MTWTVMRREIDRNVRVAECASELEARVRLVEVKWGYLDEEVWIEREVAVARAASPTLSHVISHVVPHDVRHERPKIRIPKARVVHPRVRIAPRRVPWAATIFMIGRPVAAVGVALLAGGLLCAECSGGTKHSVHLFSHATEQVFDGLGATWVLLAVLAVAVAALYQLRFLRRARVIEGVMEDGAISVVVDGQPRRVASISSAVPNGARVSLFWDGRRAVELAKAGAQIDANGNLSWDAKPVPYRLETEWPGVILALVGVAVLMLVMLVVAFL